MNAKEARDTEHVWIGRAVSRKKFHTDPDCQSLPDDVSKVTRETAAEQLGLEECAYCADEFEPSGRNQQDVFPELHQDPEVEL